MAISHSAKKAFKKAKKEQRRRNKRHWLIPQKGDSIKERISKGITMIALIVLIGCIVILANEARITISTYLLNGNLQDIYGKFLHTGGGYTDAAEELLAINSDTAGWITVADTNIDLPVVLRKTSDGNEYYLKHDFSGTSSKAGTLFADMRTEISSSRQSDNIIIYGHNQRDGSMFGDLDKYKKDLLFYKAHPTVEFSTNYSKDTYKIVGYFVTTVLPEQSRDGYVFEYNNYIELSTENTYNSFISQVMERSLVNTGVDTVYGDEFLTLSTCSNEFEPSRFVVVCRKVRANESAFVDTTAADFNRSALEPDYNYIYNR